MEVQLSLSAWFYAKEKQHAIHAVADTITDSTASTEAIAVRSLRSVRLLAKSRHGQRFLLLMFSVPTGVSSAQLGKE